MNSFQQTVYPQMRRRDLQPLHGASTACLCPKIGHHAYMGLMISFRVFSLLVHVWEEWACLIAITLSLFCTIDHIWRKFEMSRDNLPTPPMVDTCTWERGFLMLYN